MGGRGTCGRGVVACPNAFQSEGKLAGGDVCPVERLSKPPCQLLLEEAHGRVELADAIGKRTLVASVFARALPLVLRRAPVRPPLLVAKHSPESPELGHEVVGL